MKKLTVTNQNLFDAMVAGYEEKENSVEITYTPEACESNGTPIRWAGEPFSENGEYLDFGFKIEDDLTYDIYFNDESDSFNKGFHITLDEAADWIENNRTSDENFKDFAGGTVSIYCNETKEEVFTDNI